MKCTTWKVLLYLCCNWKRQEILCSGSSVRLFRGIHMDVFWCKCRPLLCFKFKYIDTGFITNGLWYTDFVTDKYIVTVKTIPDLEKFWYGKHLRKNRKSDKFVCRLWMLTTNAWIKFYHKFGFNFEEFRCTVH